MIRTLFIPVESGVHYETALAHLHRLAPLYDSRALGLRVIDTFDLEKGLEGTEEARRLLEREASRHIDGFEQNCRQWGVKVSAEVVIGETIEEIAQYTRRADLVLLGEALSDEQDGFERQQRRVRDLLHRITRPALIAREGYENLARLVVGYDGSEKGGHALQWSADLAERAAAELALVTVAATKELGTQLIEEAGAYLEGYRLAWTSHLSEGHPGEALAHVARENRADLVIVGSHGHGRFHEMAFGSTTHYVLEHIPMSLMIWR